MHSCHYLDKVKKIAPKSFPPPVFSRFDVVQQAYFKDKNNSDLALDLPPGRIMTKEKLPARVVFQTLKDNKSREFILGGRPDIVIEFKASGYRIIDFKITKLPETKSEDYKFQLEAYAQIFTKPDSIKKGPTPKLDSITHIGILQFDPSYIHQHDNDGCDMKMKTFTLH